MHYVRWKKSGDPLMVVGRRIVSEADRFWPKVDKDGPVHRYLPAFGPCWIWTGAKVSKGYGNFTRADRSSVSAHRWAFENLIGSIPDGLTIDHVCHNADEDCPGGNACSHRLCVNPAHLDLCEPIVNTKRGHTGGSFHLAKTHCPHGHPYSEGNTYTYVKDGSPRRACRICRMDASRKSKAKYRKPPPPPKTHCPHGHPYDEANTFLMTSQTGAVRKVCRTCKREANRRARART